MTASISSESMQSLPSGRSTISLTTATTPFDHLSLPEDNFDYLMPEDNFDYFSASDTTTLPPDTFTFLDGTQGEATTGLLCHDNRAFPLSLSTFAKGGSSSGDCSDTAKEVQQQSSDTFTNEQSYNILEHNPRLSSLNLDLSRRLEQCLPIAVPEDRPMLNKTGPGTPRTVDGGIAGRDLLSSSTLFEDALGDLSEFLVIIQSYASKKNGQSPEAGDISSQGFVSTPSRHISIVVFLNLISAYLQIVAIYDRIFRSLSTPLFETLNGPTSGQRTLPGLRLTGLPLGRGNLQTKIVIHAILHQFDLIERSLGLPADLRVTDKPGVYSGLFEDERARALLRAVTNGNRIENGWSQMLGGDHRSSKALSSLRETIKIVQAFLDI
jgi:hypothetical protein